MQARLASARWSRDLLPEPCLPVPQLRGNFPGPLRGVQLLTYTHWRPRFPPLDWGKLYHSKSLSAHVYVRVYTCIFIRTLLIMAEISFSSASGALGLFFNITVLGTDLIRVLRPAK